MFFYYLIDMQFLSGTNTFPAQPVQYNPLEEPSPLGLRLRKSPSLLELIQMRLSQGKPSTLGSTPSVDCQDSKSREKGSTKGSAAGATDKLKASNFPASFLKIGSWEVNESFVDINILIFGRQLLIAKSYICWQYTSRYEGDLVAKCYFAKHKLVWEILEGGLKSKIELQWSDIMGLKADFQEDAPATLVVVVC